MTTPPEEVVAEQKRDQRRTGVILIAVALVLAIALGFVYRTDRQVQLESQRSSTLEQQVVANGQIAQEAKEGVEEANRRLRAAGKPTVPVPSVSPISPPSKSEEQSLTVEQVRAVVVTELAQYKAALTQAEINQIARVAATMVPKPKDGTTPTDAEIRPIVVSAVAAYCVGDKCVGKTGTDGKPGVDGAPGKDAPKVTDAELLNAAQQALATYCAAETKPCEGKPGVDGKDGQNGTNGADGASGRSVADMDCVQPGDADAADHVNQWRITYDKPLPSGGKVSYSRGPCSASLLGKGPAN